MLDRYEMCDYNENPTTPEIKAFGALAYVTKGDRDRIFNAPFGEFEKQAAGAKRFVKKYYIAHTLKVGFRDAGPKVKDVAKHVNRSPSTIYRWMNKLGVDVEEIVTLEITSLI